MALNPESELACEVLVKQNPTLNGITTIGNRQLRANIFLHGPTKGFEAVQTGIILMPPDDFEVWTITEQNGLYSIGLQRDLHPNNAPTELVLFSGGDLPPKTVRNEWYGHTIAQVKITDEAYHPEKQVLQAKHVIPNSETILDHTDNIFNSYAQIVETAARLANCIKQLRTE